MKAGNRIWRAALSGTAAAVMALSSFGGMIPASAADEPNTYDTLEVDREAKQKFENDTAAKTKLPVINITTYQNSELILSKEVYTKCVVDVFNVDESMELDEISAGIKVRGNSSAYYGDPEKIKKNPVPYRIKFDKKQNMLGMNDGAKCKSWVLLKSDWNLVANEVALRMGRELFDDTAYCSDSQFVHLYVNDKLQGTYVLCEQCQVDENRVNITEPEKDYTGTDIGYYMELDNYAYTINDDGTITSEDPYFTMDYEEATVTDIRGIERQFVPAEYTIKSDTYSEDQVEFANKYLNNVFELLYRATEKGEYLTFDENYDLVPSEYTNAKDCITAVMDIDSVVDMYLLYEIVHDYDCGEGSFYMCADFGKEKFPKLQFTSPWDFNWAYNDSTSRYWAGAFCASSFVRRYGDRSNPWLILLAKQDWFHELCTEKWEAEKSNIRDVISYERSILKEYETDLNVKEPYGTGSAEGTLQWVDKRLNWMDETFAKPVIDLSGASASTKGKTYTYIGKDRKPTVTVTLDGKVLKKGTDYTIAYTNSKNCGKATYTVTGIGDYVGTVSGSFIIKPAKMQLSKVTKPKSKTIKAVWKKAGGKVSGYNVQIALNKTFTKGKKNYYIKKGDAVSKTITKLKKKTYYVRVRAYKKVGTKNYFGAYSNVKKVIVKK
ncbi:MAG: CotH kinase family protein [Ruminococcus sp.]|nr:CotH kinase family protein [Ruminococcus sp.]